MLKKLIIILLIVFIVTLGAFGVFDHNLYPMIKHAAIIRSRSVATYLISETVVEVLENENFDYSDIIEFEKDNMGKIVALKTDSVLMNKLKSTVSSEIHKKLASIDKQKLSFSVGSVFNSGLLVGRGPDINVEIAPYGAVTSEFISEFKASGINQTNHKIYIKINVSFSIFIPFDRITESVETSVCAAETLIIGEVPSAYTNVQNLGDFDGLDLTGDIVDFGAHDINENYYEKSDG